MFDSPTKLALGLLTGFIFGFLLQKGQVAKFQVIVGQLLLKDWTVIKIMATAVVVGSIGVYALVEGNEASLQIKPLRFGGVIGGALLFGMGMALLGYCPGTSVAACGEGRRDAMVGVVGMLFGAGAFVALYPRLQPLIQALGDRGKLTIPEALGVSPWLVIAMLTGVGLLAAILAHRRRGRPAASRLPGAGSQGPAHHPAT
jgi:uncharacterized membrane protein YedE/YeeE